MSLGLKLYVSLFLVMFACLGIYTAQNISDQKEDLIELVHQNALGTTDLIKNSIHYSMRINRKEDIEEIFKYFSYLEHIEAIRIYDKAGRIIFATDSSERDQQVTVNSEACQVCHSHAEPLKALESEDRLRITTTADNREVLALINPVENEPACARPTCHVSPESRAILGVLDVQMSLDYVYADLTRSQNRAIAGSIILVVIVLLVVGLLIWSQIRVPVQSLSNATKAIAAGNLDYVIPVKRDDEIGQLAISFNTMVEELKKARNEITEWSNTLQDKVEKKTEELQQMQTNLLHVEKMASLGKLAATVAHELNNPLTGILTYVRLDKRMLSDRNLTDDLVATVVKDLDMVGREAMRCGNIVRNLLLFSKREVGSFTNCDVNEIVDHCLHLVQHHLELHGIKLVKNIPSSEVLAICDIDRVQQALLAILMNAIEAMSDGGTLVIELNHDNAEVRIAVEDTGCGIPPDQLSNIFEPFYSSKKEGTGVGLGLSVAYGIIKAHGGEISVQSVPGQGSRFVMKIPRKPTVSADDKDLPESELSKEGDSLDRP